ncbi:uncharacterized protein LOC134473219 [Cavia porcellus]|uniref:uncharacterized protein LOC134473219 n=1 Tax=Cavia porcellus TaxID=10141 RepID=UPI002FE23505
MALWILFSSRWEVARRDYASDKLTEKGSPPPPEPRITLQVGGQPVDFLVDTGATYSVLTQPLGKLTKQSVNVIGATGGRKSYPKVTASLARPGHRLVQHDFLWVPECPDPLLGRDLLHKLQVQIDFVTNEPRLKLGTDTPSKSEGIRVLALVPEGESYRLLGSLSGAPELSRTDLELELLNKWKQEIPEVWAKNNPPGLAVNQVPHVVELLPQARPICLRQYPISLQARKEIKVHIQRLRDNNILIPCVSPWNSPLLPVQKPGTNDYRPVQDLREVNRRVLTLHPTVPNPYTLLSLLNPENTWYSVLDLKDAFFTLPLAPVSQPLFAFEWTDPDTGVKEQLTWTRLPQGYKNSPTLFDEALARDLLGFREEHPEIVLLQYIDDLLIASTSLETCQEATEELLKTLGRLGYKVSAKKAQLCRQAVTYLGYKLQEGKRTLSKERIQAILQIPSPETKKQVREFLGAVGYCRLWILNFTEIARPLYDSLKGETQKSLDWTDECEQAFQQLKRALTEAPALGLPDVTKPFTLFVDELRGIAKGVLTQDIGPWKRPIAYLSKRLDPVAGGWPPCLRILAAVAMLLKEAKKLTFRQKISVVTSHSLETLIKTPPEKWLSNARILHYQALLLDPESVVFKTSSALNPATLMPDDNPENQQMPLHECADILELQQNLRADLTDQPFKDAYNYFTDGSSFIQDGRRVAGAAVTTEKEVLWAKQLEPGTSAQKAELIALTEALKLASGKRVNIYTDSRYAFATVHVHGAIYHERGLLTSAGTKIKNAPQILDLLAAVWLPQQVAIIHCKAHQVGDDPIIIGNNLADQAARKIATTSEGPAEEMTALMLVPQALSEPVYSKTDLQLASQLGAKPRTPGGWYQLPDKRVLLPEALGRELLQQAHQATHLGGTKLAELFRDRFFIPKLSKLTASLSSRCPQCLLVNPTRKPPLETTRYRGTSPGKHWEVDFTDMSLQSLQPVLTSIHRLFRQKHPNPPLGTLPQASIEPGTSVLVRRHHRDSLEPRWEGPFTVVLSTPTSVKVAGKTAWIHHTQVKPLEATDEEKGPRWTVQRTDNPLKLKFVKDSQP